MQSHPRGRFFGGDKLIGPGGIRVHRVWRPSGGIGQRHLKRWRGAANSYRHRMCFAGWPWGSSRDEDAPSPGRYSPAAIRGTDACVGPQEHSGQPSQRIAPCDRCQHEVLPQRGLQPDDREHHDLRRHHDHQPATTFATHSTSDISLDWRMPLTDAEPASRFVTVETCQRPPRRVSMPRTLSSPAIALRLVAPPVRMSAITGQPHRRRRESANAPRSGSPGSRMGRGSAPSTAGRVRVRCLPPGPCSPKLPKVRSGASTVGFAASSVRRSALSVS